MRKLLLILATAILLASCKEEPPHCWQCNYRLVGPPDKHGDTILCNLTKTDIELREGILFSTSIDGYDEWEISNCQQQ